MQPVPYRYKIIESPISDLRLIASPKGLCAVLYNDGRNARLNFEGTIADDSHPVLNKAEKQLGDYFAGTRKEFDLKLDMQGTIFQIKIWKELQKIPYGCTISYGEQARRIGDASKAHAVSVANGRNPLPIIVPCHRVTGREGKVGGAAGVRMKEYLLALEQVGDRA